MGRDRWDAVVVGAGPAGSMAANRLLELEPDKRVLMLDRRARVGHPYQCAGGITDFHLERSRLKPPSRLISCTIDGLRIYGPDGSYVEAEKVDVEGGRITGRVLDREAFDEWMARRALKRGAELRLRHTVTGATPSGLRVVAREDDAAPGLTGVRPVKGPKGFVEGTLPLPPALILADGWTSLTGAALGIDTSVPDAEMYMGLQHTVPVNTRPKDGPGKGGPGESQGRGGKRKPDRAARNAGTFPDMSDLERTKAAFVFGRELFPAGYGWAFPEGGEDLWRIGLGCQRGTTDMGGHLRRFIEGCFFGAGPPVRTIGGGIPCSRPPDRNSHRVGDTDAYLVGDAGRVCDPLTGGGLANAFVTGEYAGENVARGLPLKEFDRRWKAEIHRELVNKYRMKKVFMSWSDDELARAVRTMGDFSARTTNPRREMARLMRHIMVREPRLFASMVGTMMRG